MTGQHRGGKNGGNVRVIEPTDTLPALPAAPIILDEHRLAAAMVVAAIEEGLVTDMSAVSSRAAVIMRMRQQWNGTRLRCSRCGGLYTVAPEEEPNWQIAGMEFGTCWPCTVAMGRALPIAGDSETETNTDGG